MAALLRGAAAAGISIRLMSIGKGTISPAPSMAAVSGNRSPFVAVQLW